MNNKDNEMKINKITLSFNKKLEQDFRDFYYYSSIGVVRKILFLGIIFYAMFAILDCIAFPSIKNELFFIRFVIICPLITVCLISSFSKKFAHLWQQAISFTIVISGIGIVAMTYLGSFISTIEYYPGIILVLIYCYMMIKLRFIWASLSGLIIVVSYIITAFFIAEIPVKVAFTNSFLLSSVNFLGMFGSYLLEYYTRKEFFLTNLLKKEKSKVLSINEDLEARVELRTKQLEQEIIEHKKAAIKEKEFLKNSKLLAKVAIDFMDFPKDKNIYHFVGAKLKEFLDLDAFIVVSSINSEKQIATTEAIIGPATIFKKYSEFIGYNPIGKTFDASKILEKKIDEEKLTYFEDGLYGLLLNTVPKVICKTMEKLFNINKVYTIKLKKDNDIFGTLVIILRNKSDNIENFHIIEAFIKQAAIAIKKYELEKELVASEKRFQNLSNLTFEGILIHKNGVLIDCNESLAKMFECNLKDVVGMNVVENFILPEFHDLIKKNLTKSVLVPYEVVGRKSDGSLIPLELETKEIIDEKTGVRVTAVRDITERKNAQKTLEKSEKKYRTIIETTSEGYIFLNKDNIITDINKSLSIFLEYSREEILGKTPLEFVDNDSQKVLLQHLVRKNLFTNKNYEVVVLSKTGKKIPVIINANSMFDENQEYIGSFAFVTNISERKQAEKQLQKIEKLESIGTLAGGIAHDFNNILTGIYGNISMMQAKSNNDEPLRKYLNNILNSMERATKLSTQLLTFSKGGTPIKENVNLQELIVGIVKFDLSGSNVKPIFDIEENPWNTEVDIGQMQQVFSNLTINANQASPNGGKLYIKMKNCVLHNQFNLTDGKYVKISFTDEGTGISKDNLEKIFDPYFTTKATGNGLGLATTFSIIQKHNGYVHLESEVGIGTTFTIYLPVSQEFNVSDDQSHDQVQLDNKAKQLNVLVMDDEEIICDLVTKMLSMLGHKSKAVVNGEEAITEYESTFNTSEQYDLVIMDLTIPGGMGGKDAVEKILEIDENAKVIVSSGYSNDSITSEYEKYGFIGKMSKPYTMKFLKETLCSIDFS